MPIKNLIKIRKIEQHKYKFQQLLKDILIIVILPNLGFVFISYWLELHRSLINIDYIACILVGVLFWRPLGTMLLALALFIDALALVIQIFPVPHLGDLIYLITQSVHASWFMIAVLTAAIFILLSKLLAIHLLQRQASLINCLFIFNIFLIGCIISTLTNPNSYLPKRFFLSQTENSSLAISQGVHFFMTRKHSFIQAFQGHHVVLSDTKYKGASQTLFAKIKIKKNIPKRILFIISESWGTSKNPEINNALISPLKNIALSTSYQQGDLGFLGATISGELRELCRQKSNAYNLSTLQGNLPNCLPAKLAAQGYATYALHAANGAMYERKDWYPKAGFQHLTFFENQIFLRRCYSFPGACDIDLFPKVLSAFEKESKIFFYWLTLNSHHPYDNRDIFADYFNCTKYDIDPKTESCRNLKLQAQFFNNLANFLKKPTMSGVHVIIVGDHSPIITNSSEKDSNFIKKSIPWVTLQTP